MTSTPKERKLYDDFRKDSLELVIRAFDIEGRMKSFHTLQSILRLRQIRNHGMGLFPQEAREKLDLYSPGGAGSMFQEAQSCEMCGIVIGDQDDDSQFDPSCFHVLRASCASKGKEEGGSETGGCPLCAGNATLLGESSSGVQTPEPPDPAEDYQPSSKVSALLTNLRAYRTESPDEPIKRYKLTHSAFHASIPPNPPTAPV